MRVSVPVLTAAASLIVLAAVPAKATDFDCAAPHTVSEKTICASASLSRLDERMARFYGWLWASLDDGQRQSLHDEQRLFLAFRDACGVDTICLRASYLTRIEDLADRLRKVIQARHVS